MYLHLDHESATLILNRALDRIDSAFQAFNRRILFNFFLKKRILSALNMKKIRKRDSLPYP